MRRLFFSSLFPWLLLASATVRADDFLPKPAVASRYDKMADRSPFMAPSVPVAAAPTPPPAAGPHWWDQMAVTSVMQKGDRYFATVDDRQNAKHYVLESGKVDEESHLTVASVQLADHLDQTTVTLRKDAEIAPPLHFETAGVTTSPGTQPGPAIPGAMPPRPLANPGQAMFNGNPAPPAGIRPPPGQALPNPNMVRRPGGPIQARPPATVPSNGALNRPAPQLPNAARRPVIPASDDDDDD